MIGRKDGGVYVIRNTTTEQCYVGSCKNFDKRRWMHFWLLKTNQHYNEVLQQAWNEYGADSFAFEVIEAVADPEQRLSREQHFIDVLEPKYNLSPLAGISTGTKHTEASRVRMSNGQRSREPVSEETRAKRSANLKRKWEDPDYRAHMGEVTRTTHLGRKRSDETRARLSAMNRERDHSHLRALAAAQKGTSRSAEYGAKVSVALKGREFSEEHRRNLSLASHSPASQEMRRRREERSEERVLEALALLGGSPSVNAIAKATGMKWDTVKRAVDRLASADKSI